MARGTRTWRAVALAGLVAAASLTTAAPAGATPGAPADPPARVETWLADQLARSSDPQLVLVGATSAGAAERAIEQAGASTGRSFQRIGFAAAMLTPAQVEVVRAQTGVRYLQGNRPLQSSNETATRATRVQDAEATYLDDPGLALDGTGIGIAVVDSGMAGDHPMYQDAAGTGTRLLNIKQACVFSCSSPGDVDETFFVDATGLDTDVTATGGHGTHVAAIAGGRKITTANGVDTRGVATNASLYGLGAGAGIFTLNAAASLNWVLEHHEDPCGAFPVEPAVVGGCHPIRVVNNSYGSVGEYDPQAILAVLSERLVLDGVVVVWAAGNGPEITDTDPPPNDGTVNLVNPEAVGPLPGIIAVANYDDGDTGTRTGEANPGSSRGERGRPETYPDVSAPGTKILAACRPYLPICSSSYPDPNYGEITGTSMAAPHVAGIVALLLQAHPELTPAQVEDLLEDTSHAYGDLSEYEPDVATADAPLPNQVRNGDHRTHYFRGHGLTDLAAALGEVDANPPSPFAEPCTAGITFAADPAGDATDHGGLGPAAPGELSDPNFDITGVGVQLRTTTAPDGSTQDVARFTVDVQDLAGSPPSLGTGEYVRYDFTYQGFASELIMDREISGATAFTWIIPGLPTGTVTLARGLVGSFDAEADQVWVELPAGAVVEDLDDDDDGTTEEGEDEPAWPNDLTPLAEGARIGNVSVLMQRQVGVPTSAGATLTTDSALGGCPFTLSALAPPVVPDLPLPAVAIVAGGLLVLVLARRGRKAGAALALVGIVVAGSLAPATEAGAVTEPSITFTQPDEAIVRDVTVDEPNVDSTCVEEDDSGEATVTDGPHCLIIPFTTEQPDSRRLQYVAADVTPTSQDAAITDLDVYVIDVVAKRVVASAASAAAPVVGNVHEIAFGRLPGDGRYQLVVQAYQNAPGATYQLVLRSYARAEFVD